MPKDTVIYSPTYSPILPHFPRVPTRIFGQETFNTLRQRHVFVDSSGTAINLTHVIYHENHNKCYIFTDISKLKLAYLSTFPSSTKYKFVMCKDRHLNVPKKVEISEDESTNSGINTPNIRHVNKDNDKHCSKQIDTNSQNPEILDNQG